MKAGLHDSVIEFLARLDGQLSAADRDGLFKREHQFVSSQGAEIVEWTPAGDCSVLNLC